jgi:hypothetical protein
MAKVRNWLTAGVITVVACGSGTSTESPGDASSGRTGDTGGADGSGGRDGSIIDASGDAPPPADAPFACGSETCAPTEYCIHPCCGGAPLPCFSKPEAGTCPEGSREGCSFPGSGTCTDFVNCCQPNPCTPPAPYCSGETESGCLLQGRDCLLLCA